MKKGLCLLAAALIMANLTPAFAEGWLYTDSTRPGDFELQSKTDVRTGYAKCYNVLNLVEWGNCSFDAAMENGKIKQAHHYDYNVNGWIFFKKVTTIVHGE